MGVIDKFLNAMKLNDEEGFGEDDYLDEDYEEEQEVQPKKHILKKLEEEDEEEDLIQQSLAASPERASAARTSRPKVVRTNFFLQGFSDAPQKKRHRKERRDGGLRDQTTQHGRCKRDYGDTAPGLYRCIESGRA